MTESNNPNGAATGWDHLVGRVAEYLEYQRDAGVSEIEMNPEILRSLSMPVTASVASGPGAAMQAVAARISSCTRCPLHSSRTKTVPGQGSLRPEIMFIGEGPGADEDRQGLAFVGRAGQLLTKMITAMGYSRDDVWIGNIVKCRPPGNRVPAPEEMDACLPYLREQITLLKPKVIVALGATAVKGLFEGPVAITKMRGKWLRFEDIDTMPTYHPAYLLRNPPAKREVWEDMKEVLRKLGREVPEKKQDGPTVGR